MCCVASPRPFWTGAQSDAWTVSGSRMWMRSKDPRPGRPLAMRVFCRPLHWQT